MIDVRAVSLDFYGTLVWDDDDATSVICECVRSHAGRPVTTSGVRAHWWNRYSALCTRARGEAFVPLRKAAAASLVETAAYFAAKVDVASLLECAYAHWVAPPVFPETLEFLEHLRASRIPFCIVSDTDRADISAALIFHGWTVEHLVTSEDARAYKPWPEMFRLALKQLRCEPSEVLHVGDSCMSDVAGATAMGMPVAWINRTGQKAGSDGTPTHTVDNLMDVLPILG